MVPNTLKLLELADSVGTLSSLVQALENNQNPSLELRQKVINQIGIACEIGVSYAPIGEMLPKPFKFIALSLQIALGDNIAQACHAVGTVTEPFIEDGISAYLNAFSNQVNDLAPTTQQATILSNFQSAVESGNFSAAVTASNQFINDADFLGPITTSTSGIIFTTDTNATVSVNNSWRPLEASAFNDDGSSINSRYSDLDEGELTHVDYHDQSGQLSKEVSTRIDGSSEVTGYSDSDLVARVSVDSDGNAQYQSIDPTTGETVLTTDTDEDGKITSQEIGEAGAADYSKFARAVADTLATQLISKILIQNNLPVSIAAQAFADASIASAAAGTVADFPALFANSVFNISGGIAGSEAGTLVADALGVPNEIGTLAGGTAGNLLAQSLANSAAEELGIRSAGEVLTAANFASGFAAAGGTLAGAELASLVMPTNLTGEITGAVNAAMVLTTSGVLEFAPLIFETNPVGAVLLVFSVAMGSDFLGTIIGDLFGGLFGGQPSVGPGAGAECRFNFETRTFELGYSNADNGGDVTIAQNLVQAEAANENMIMQATGAKVIGNVTNDTLGYFKGKFFYAPGSQPPLDFPDTFDNADAAVTFALLRQMRTAEFTGGNLLMALMLQKTTATTLEDLMADLAAARDYALYSANPSAFNLSLALSGDAAQFATWQTELARIQTLGLDGISVLGMARNIYGTGGVDFFIRSASGQLTIAEFNNIGQQVAGGALTYTDNSIVSVNSTDTIVSICENKFGTSGRDIFVKDSEGHIRLLALNSQGKIVEGSNLPLIGTFFNFYGLGCQSVFFQPQPGAIGVWDFDATGMQVGDAQITDTDGVSLLRIPSGTVIANIGWDLYGTGTRELYLKHADGSLEVVSINGQQQKIAGSVLTRLGSGVGLFANGQDIFFRTDSGQFGIVEFNDLGQQIGGGLITFPGGAPVLVPEGATILGVGWNLFGTGGSDVYVKRPEGQVVIIELDGLNRWVQGNNVAVLGESENLLGAGGRDVFYQTITGQLAVVEFDTLGQQVAGGLVTMPDGSPLLVSSADMVIHTAHDALGTGGGDIFIRYANGQTLVIEINDERQQVASNDVTVNADGSWVITLSTGLPSGQDHVINYYSSTNKLTESDIYYADGTRDDIVFEPSAGVGSIDDFYVASGQLSSTTQENTDGSMIETDFNLSGGGNWTKEVQHFTATGLLAEDDTWYVSGSRDEILYDLTGGPIHAIDNYYNASNVLLSSFQDNDDGSSVETDYNPSGADGWTKGVHYLNAAGQDTEDDIYYEDGSHDDTVYNDLAGGNLHSTKNYILEDGTLVNTTKSFNDGTRISIDYDLDGEDWITGSRYYDASDNLLQTDVLYEGDGHWMYVHNLSTTLAGGTGYNGYEFVDASFGNDTINNGGGTAAHGEIDFDSSSITKSKLWFKHVGNDLTIQKLGSSNKITVAGWYTSGQAGNQVEEIHAGGLTLDTQVAQLVNAMATYQAAHSSFNPNTATTMPTDATLQNAITAAWHS
jgi:hypothetical protein